MRAGAHRRKACGVRRLGCHAAAACALLWLPLILAGCETPRRGPTVEKFIETREVAGAWVTVTLITGNGKRAVAASDAAFACLDSVDAGLGEAAEGSALDSAARGVIGLAPSVPFDRGALALGHAIDRAVAAVRREGVEDGVVQIGDQLRCFGAIPAALVDQEAVLPVRTLRSRPVKRPAAGQEAKFEGLRRSEGASPVDPRPWQVGLPGPLGDRLLGRIQVGDRAVATHPAAGTAASVTVIAASALEAGALAQIVAALDVERGLALAESLPGVEALVVRAGGAEAPDLRRTSGFPALEPVH